MGEILTIIIISIVCFILIIISILGHYSDKHYLRIKNKNDLNGNSFYFIEKCIFPFIWKSIFKEESYKKANAKLKKMQQYYSKHHVTLEGNDITLV